jgi:putative membrane protein
MRNTMRAFKILSSILIVSSVTTACERQPDAAVDTAVGAVDSVARATVNEYTEPELLGLLNEGERGYVEASQFAQTRATDPEVKAFARQIISNHKPLTADISSTAKTLNVTPVIPTNDEDVVEDRVEGMTQLRAKPVGKEFDEAYLEYEIRMHKKILDEVNDALGRNQRAEIRTLLEKLRTSLQSDLQRAEELEKKFGIV